MAEKDLCTKVLEKYPDVYADIFNVLFFGKKVIDPKFLISGPTESVFNTPSGQTRQQTRDSTMYKMSKNWRHIAASLHIGNQTSIQDIAPIRVIGYDAASYKDQLFTIKKDEEKEPLYPVFTIILNFSDRRWNKPTNLKSLLTIEEGMEEFVQDYKVHVYDIAYLEDDLIEQFESDFKVIARFFNDRRNKKDIRNDIEIQHPEAVLDMLSAFTNDPRYLEAAPYILGLVKKGEGTNMCTIADGLIANGKIEILSSMVADGTITREYAAEKLHVSTAVYDSMVEEFNKKKEQN